MKYLVGLLAVVVLVGCGGSPAALAPTNVPSCKEQAAVLVSQIQPLAREWDDANTLASSTPRSSLSAQIDKLQAMRRKAQDLEAPQCAFLVRQRLIDAMDNTINGYLAFLSQKPESEVNKYFDQAKQSMDGFGKEIAALK